MYANEVLPKEYHVKPLEDGQSVTFEQIFKNGKRKSNRTNVDTNSPVPIVPRALLIQGRVVVKVKQTGKSVTIGNVTNEEIFDDPVTGKPITRHITTQVLFERGVKTVTSNDPGGTYQFLMRHPRNESNPFRDMTKQASFRVQDRAADVRNKLAKLDLKDQTVDLIRMASYEDLLALGRALPDSLKSSVDLTKDVGEIRLSLRRLIENGNEISIIKASQDVKAKVTVQVMEAEQFNFIMRNSDMRTWKFQDGKVILEDVPMNEDMMTAIVDRILKNKLDKEYKLITEFLKTIKG